MYTLLFKNKMSTYFPSFPPYCSNAFAHGMYAKYSELWVTYNLFNRYIMYALDSVHKKVRRMKRCRYLTVLSDKPSRIERNCRPECKSADPNWFVCRTFHALNSNFRFGTWKVRRLNRALAKLASYVFLF